VDFSGFVKSVRSNALLIQDNDVCEAAADEAQLPTDGADDSSSVVIPRNVVCGAAQANDLEFFDKVIVFHVIDYANRRNDVVTDAHDNGLRRVHRAYAKRNQWCLRLRLRHTQRGNLRDITDFHTYVINHSDMESFGLKIQIVAFLTGVCDRETLCDLLFSVLQNFFKIAEGLWPNARD